jgi:putative flippase GtrA
MMNKADAAIAAFIGEITAMFFFYFLNNAQNAATGEYIVPDPFRSYLWLLMVVFPILAPFCLWIAAQLGKKFISIYQLAKFLLVGVMATIFDLGTLSIFMAVSRTDEGIGYIIFKSVSFIISAALKYFPDKFWAFKKTEKTQTKKEFLQFFAVTLASFVVNVGVASALVNIMGPQFDLDKTTWANVAAMGGVIVAFALNFIGYKFFVFKK